MMLAVLIRSTVAGVARLEHQAPLIGPLVAPLSSVPSETWTAAVPTTLQVSRTAATTEPSLLRPFVHVPPHHIPSGESAAHSLSTGTGWERCVASTWYGPVVDAARGFLRDVLEVQNSLRSWPLVSQHSKSRSSPFAAEHEFSRARLPDRADVVDEDSLRHIPDYVIEYAPYVYLYSEEEYWPSLMQDHVAHTTPYVNYTPVDDKYRDRDLDNLDGLNGLGRMYLQSNDDPESYPPWLGGADNIPNDSTHRSPAPATLFVVDKGEYLDAFWFFFYSFNLGNQVLGVRFGNHVGDWEHTAIRFRKSTGKPIEVFYSEHEWGAAHKWEDAEKYDDKRMLTYSAFGTHAMYRTSGVQRYVLPFGLLQDITDRGPLWDPVLNLYAYTYDPKADVVRASNLSPDVPENWFHYSGHWGDKAYPMDDPRQYRFAGELHYDSGPTGPKFKNLGRSHICQNEDTCLKHLDLNSVNSTIVITEDMWKMTRDRRNLAS